MKKNITYLEEHNEFCWSFENKMKLPSGHSTWTVYFFFFNFFFHFLNWPGVLQQRKVRPYFPYSWEIRDSSVSFLFLFFFYFVGSLQCLKERLSQNQIPSHQTSEKNSLHRKYFTFGQDVKCTFYNSSHQKSSKV